ncbi:hypothetical protein HPB49_003534 [Dermacentor silvarum]|uniref:Uncharacterized protein n=2 Tax=Dermacentor silvarum TaxID=543639 RepID=A0ACB8CD53_DERSI|nr:hypothetical protein HPB49_003534 [Dermacentor silvarum]
MPRSVLSDPRLLSMLSCTEIDDLLMTETERQYLSGSLDDVEDLMRRNRESELLLYRSRNGLLDTTRIEAGLFRQQFRFEKVDFDELLSALLLPESVRSAQNVNVSGREALCITLRRLAYPNRWCDLEPIFGRHSSVMSSVASKVIRHITGVFGHLMTDCNHHDWLSITCLEDFAKEYSDPVAFIRSWRGWCKITIL